MLKWMWDMSHRLNPDGAIRLARLGASRVLPIVLRVYDTDSTASREIITEAYGPIRISALKL
jgi:hypothetical protein